MDRDLISDPTKYQSMVGALQQLTMTKPDIAYVVNLISQFMHAPLITHLLVMQRIFCYLQGAIDHGLVLKKTDNLNIVVAYNDANWAGYPDSSCSTIGYAVFLGPTLVSWRSKKQPTVS